MPSSEAQRTLVKSPPELWTELADPASLARHLGDFGEIRIARTEAETIVEWEGEAVTGSVQLKPSGWGTKVTLTVVREPPAPATAAPEQPEPEGNSEPEASPEPEGSSEPEAPAEPLPGADAAAQAPLRTTRRSRLFSRLFRRRGTRAIERPQPASIEAETEAEQPEQGLEEVQPQDLAAELALVEETMAAQDAALLSAVLDRLGAAHHRPFSRG
jgi:hypothetical protein